MLFVLLGDGATGLDSHTAKRAAAAVATRCQHAREGDGAEPDLGRRENCCHYVKVRIVTVLIYRKCLKKIGHTPFLKRTPFPAQLQTFRVDLRNIFFRCKF